MSTASQHFFQLVSKGSQQLAALCDLCEHEKTAIESHSAEQLREVVEKKKELLLNITENISQRNEILLQNGHSTDDSGFEQFLQQLPTAESTAIKKAWGKLSDQLAQVTKLNDRNEKIVKRSQTNMEQLLNIMQGHSTKTTLYNQAGSKGNYSAQNTLGKA